MLPYYQGGYLPNDDQQPLKQSNKEHYHQLDASSLEPIDQQQQQQQQQQTNYTPYTLMHSQPYPDFAYDGPMIDEHTLTPLPDTGYIRQQEDVFNELLSLANHRQHIPSSSSSSSLSSPSQHDYSHPFTLPTTTGSPLSQVSWDHPQQDRQYELKVVQQPYRARMCGFGDKDRRPISPPPIVQMLTRTKDGQIIKPESIDVSFFLVACDSWHEDGTTEANLIYHSISSPQLQPQLQQQQTSTEEEKTFQMRNLVGSSVASATKLYDLDGNLGIFYIFQDVSFRTEGKFKLAFSLINVGSSCGNTVNTTPSSQVLSRVYTDMFTVYTAKKFPGVVKSTALSQCFAKQGVKIPIRKETQAKRRKS
ncbi:velvet factor-domain-containing protein [Chlamydoabsidia padenii]|nr:velvet factor-domain-containing protein [Chlamydoabsidia padenii]